MAVFLKDLFENLPLDHSFAKLRAYINSNLLERLIDTKEKTNILELFTEFISLEKELKIRHPELFNYINISFCETYIQIIKTQNLVVYKSDGFISAFQLYLCKSISNLLKEINPTNLESILLTIGLLIELFKKTKGFCPEIFNGLRKVSNYLNLNFIQLEEKEIYLRWIIFLINSMFILIANDVNLDILMKDTIKNLEDILPTISSENIRKDLLICIEKVKFASIESELKNSLNIVKEKPLMMIKQLTPRIIEKKKKYNIATDKNDTQTKDRIKVLKKQMKLNSKKIKKQLIGENISIAKEKMKKEEHIVRIIYVFTL